MGLKVDKNKRIGYETYQTTLDNWVNEYVDDLGIKITTKYAYDKIKDGLSEMLRMHLPDKLRKTE